MKIINSWYCLVRDGQIVFGAFVTTARHPLVQDYGSTTYTTTDMLPLVYVTANRFLCSTATTDQRLLYPRVPHSFHFLPLYDSVSIQDCRLDLVLNRFYRSTPIFVCDMLLLAFATVVWLTFSAVTNQFLVLLGASNRLGVFSLTNNNAPTLASVTNTCSLHYEFVHSVFSAFSTFFVLNYQNKYNTRISHTICKTNSNSTYQCQIYLPHVPWNLLERGLLKSDLKTSTLVGRQCFKTFKFKMSKLLDSRFALWGSIKKTFNWVMQFGLLLNLNHLYLFVK